MKIDLLKEVEAGLARGWSFTPLRGKIPVHGAWQQAEPPTLAMVREWIEAGYNIGLRTGSASGVTVIDIEAEAWTKHWRFPKTVTAFTGGGGYHLYYQPPNPPIGNMASTLVDPETGEKMGKVDVRGDRGQVVFVGSVHPETRKQYRWLVFHKPDEIELAPFPVAFLPQKPSRPPDLIQRRPYRNADTTAYAKKSLDNGYNRVATTPEGSRNDALCRTTFDLAGGVGAGWLDATDLKQTMILAGLACGLPRHEVERTVANAIAAGSASPKQMDLAIASSMQEIPEFTGF